MAILTEFPEITDTLFTPNKGLLKAIDEANKWLEYLIISDFPDETPKTWFHFALRNLIVRVDALNRGLKNRITLVTKLTTSEEGLVAMNKLLEQVILLVDTLAKHKFRPEVIHPLGY
jgi:Protein of unknown function (DUF1682)